MHLRSVAVFVLGAALTCDGAEAQQPRSFGGKYENLQEVQQELLGEWARRFAEVTGEKKSARQIYDSAPESVLTTFEAVTHALLNTPLMAEDGASVGRAIDLVEYVEQVLGERRGSRGDYQYRIHAELRPDAVDVLERDKSFNRGHNGVFHHGFPLSFRYGETPSIQFSISEDGRRSDIDVDYRSSSPFVALFNGHLSAHNSDVRPRGNYHAHVRRSDGISAWWRGLFGLRAASHESHQEDVDSGLLGELPAPDEARGELDQAVEHFLGSWLIEKDIAVTTAYFDDRTHPCVHMPDGRLAPDHRTARLELYRELRATSTIVGSIAGLDEAMTRPEPWLRDLKLLTTDEDRPYLLFDASNDTWHALDCSQKGHPAHFFEAARQKNLDKGARGVAFTVTDPEGTGVRVHQIWKRLGRRWRIIAFERDFESAAELGQVSASRWQLEPEARKEVEGDREMIQTALRFYEQWLVKQRIRAALKYVDAEAFSCWSTPGAAPGEWRRSVASRRAGTEVYCRQHRTSQEVGRRDQVGGSLVVSASRLRAT